MILDRASLRYLLRHPWLVGLSVLGVALGVAVAVAVDLANESARRAFQLSVETLSGRFTHQIVGGPNGLPESVYRRLRVDAGVRSSRPVVEGYARAPQFPGETFQLIGVDLFADAEFRSDFGGLGTRAAVTRLLTQPATGVLARHSARRLGLNAGDTLMLSVGGQTHSVTIVDFIDAADPVSRQALDAVVLTDIATAQELLGMRGRLNRIDLVISGDNSALLERVRAVLPAGTDIIRAEQRSHALDQMTRAFRVNLTALSLLALLVGTFLIYNIMTFSVIQRRALIGSLRVLGVTRRQIFVRIVTEALVIGLLGTALGVALGIMLGNGLVERVVRTINDLYFVLSVREVTLVPWSLLRGTALGLGATVAAALLPAWEATRAPVSAVLRRSTTEARARQLAPRAAVAGLASVALGTLLLAFPSRSLLLAYSGLFALIIGAALLIPWATMAVMRGLQGVMGAGLGVPGRLAVRGVVATLSRTVVAVSALAVAVSASVGVGIMIDSFRHSFVDWLTATLRADIYVAAPVIHTSPSAATLDAGLVARLAAVRGVAAISTGRRVRLDAPAGTTQLFVLDTTQQNFQSYQFKRGDADSIWKLWQGTDAVIVSEPYAYHHIVDMGGTIQLRTDDGERAFTVVGVYTEYGADEGRVTMSRRTYDRHWSDRAITFIRIYARAGTDVAELLARLRDAATGHEIRIRSHASLREASIEVFDRTFAITAVLRLLATIVAFIGVLSALMALQLERARELAILRATGLTPRQLWQLVTAETGLMGFCAGLFAIPLGIGMALALILVINRRSFGWTLQVSVEPMILVQGLLLALIAALLAGLYPAFKMTRTPPALALREE